MWNDVTTERLLSQAARGDCVATVQLFDSELEPMYETACLLLGNVGDPLETVRQSVATAVENLGELKEASRFSSWAKTFVVRSAVQYLLERDAHIMNRDANPYELMAVERWGDWEHGEILELVLSTVRPKELDDTEAAPDCYRMMLQRQLHSLPDDLRIAFVLRDILGFRDDETCVLLGVSPEEVRSLLAAARHKLVMSISNALRSMAVQCGGNDETPDENDSLGMLWVTCN